jgi:hypothetical protein
LICLSFIKNKPLQRFLRFFTVIWDRMCVTISGIFIKQGIMPFTG